MRGGRWCRDQRREIDLFRGGGAWRVLCGVFSGDRELRGERLGFVVGYMGDRYGPQVVTQHTHGLHARPTVQVAHAWRRSLRPAPTPPRWAVIAGVLVVVGLMVGGWW